MLVLGAMCFDAFINGGKENGGITRLSCVYRSLFTAKLCSVCEASILSRVAKAWEGSEGERT